MEENLNNNEKKNTERIKRKNYRTKAKKTVQSKEKRGEGCVKAVLSFSLTQRVYRGKISQNK